MKICYVNPTRMPRPIYMLARHLANRGHAATILQPTGGIQRYSRWENIRIISLPCHYLPEVRYPLPSLKLEYQILDRLIREERYDLIHVQDYWNLPAVPPILIRRRLGVPITLTNNALVGVNWQYGQWLFDQAAKLYTYTLGRCVLQSYNRLFFYYREMAIAAQGLLGDRTPPWQVLPVGVDMTCFQRVSDSAKRLELRIQDREKVILFVGRLVAVKRIELVLKLTERLLSKGMPVRTLIVGGGQLGNLSTEQRYRRLAQPLGPAVTFTGPIRQEELPDYYSLADVVVLPSRSEGLPGALLEASACETPCVASDVGGVTEIVVHGETGYVFPPDDFEALVSYVETILNDQALARRMGQRSREWVLTHFNWERITDRYEEAFRSLVT